MSAKSSLISSSDSGPWLSAVNNTVHDVFCSHAWTCAAAEIDLGRPFLVTTTEGAESMVTPVLLREYAEGVIDATSPYGYSGPAFSQGATTEFRELALQDAARLLKNLGAVTWFVRCNPLLDPLPTEGPGTLVRHGATVSVDLTLDHQTRWDLMNSGHRYEIRRALRQGLEVIEDNSAQGWQSFKRMYEQTMIGLGSRPYYLFSDSHWQLLRALALSGYGTLLLARVDGTFVGGAVFLHEPSTPIVHYHLSGTHPDFKRLNPSKVLISHAQELFKSAGIKTLHLGGGLGSRDDGLLAFKRGFSPAQHTFHSRRIVLDPDRYERLCSARGVLGSDFFPAYRG
jgi:hypothetical protein